MAESWAELTCKDSILIRDLAASYASPARPDSLTLPSPTLGCPHATIPLDTEELADLQTDDDPSYTDREPATGPEKGSNKSAAPSAGASVPVAMQIPSKVPSEHGGESQEIKIFLYSTPE
jgi:hypothetical protein